ncbi:MAG TPA: bifunctional phosphoribosylaminoimidazolecarboxamide formyltransferase/IMP cyclohydrolase [Longimicrobiales bacterium]|nr:bifunctional phosphoribosylaminoimidazolecarboxamide formyltransferase/IMP cyclohydrolase [Longimicrobiales bacterium]
MPRAILSVSNKTGLVEFARDLAQLGWELVSTGGTAKSLRDAGLFVRDVAEITGHPEMMDGRVKTLHPAVHAGILARRDVAADAEALAAQGYEPVDLVAVNLYRFREAVAAGADTAAAMGKVDIGGPTMLRAAAKNHENVLVVVDPADYRRVLDALRSGAVELTLRAKLAGKVFRHTAEYDRAIAEFFSGAGAGVGAGAGAGERPRTSTSTSMEASAEWPTQLRLDLAKLQDLRYGENPDQAAAFYAIAGTGGLPSLRQLQGKELSFNNLMDIDAAVMAVSAFAGAGAAGGGGGGGGERKVACAILKHTTPCGVALGEDALAAYQGALATDPTSAFGGIVAYSAAVSGAAAEAMASHFLEVIVAPAFEPEALAALGRKKNLRLIEMPIEAGATGEPDYRSVRGGILAQHRLRMTFSEDDWKVVTKRAPTDAEWRDLRFAWRVVAAVKSNAIVLARDERTIGIGAGQMSRVDSSRVAVMKAHDQGFEVGGAALASDAFFPFRDGVDAAAGAGARAVIQPGGSVRDEEVIAAADEHDLAMVLTGRRVFRH